MSEKIGPRVFTSAISQGKITLRIEAKLSSTKYGNLIAPSESTASFEYLVFSGQDFLEDCMAFVNIR